MEKKKDNSAALEFMIKRDSNGRIARIEIKGLNKFLDLYKK